MVVSVMTARTAGSALRERVRKHILQLSRLR